MGIIILASWWYEIDSSEISPDSHKEYYISYTGVELCDQFVKMVLSQAMKKQESAQATKL